MPSAMLALKCGAHVLSMSIMADIYVITLYVRVHIFYFILN